MGRSAIRLMKRTKTRTASKVLRSTLLTLLGAVGVAVAPEATATQFTETVPNGNGTIPNTYPPVGGTLFTFIGANGNIYYQFVNPSTQFEGFQYTGQPAAFRGNPFQLGPTQNLNCGTVTCSTYFGGSIVEGYARLTARDGDACSGNFDFNDVFFEVNGIRVGSFSDVQAERTSRDGTTSIGFENCFRNQGNNETSTGWYDLTNVPGLLDNILQTGSTTPFVFDDDGSTNRGDNFWFFRDGNDATGTPEVAPGITIDKSADRTSYSAVGDVINYNFEVKNIGSVLLSNIVVTDSFISGNVACPMTSLASGESMTCTGQHVVTQQNIDNDIVFVNTANVSATPREGTLGNVSGTLTIPGPAANNSLTLVKAANPAANLSEGDTVSYTYDVQNTGNITLDNVSISDTHSGSGALSAIMPASVTLAPGASQQFTATYTITQDDFDAGADVINTAVANAQPRRGAITLPSDEASVSLANPSPAASLTKSAATPAGTGVGDTVTYTYTVENTGDVTLRNLSIGDVQSGSGNLSAIMPANVATLAPGASSTFTATYVLTQADIDSGADITNTATLSATPERGTLGPVTATEAVTPEAADPGFTLVKTANPTTGLGEGDTVTYTYVVTNTGNVGLANVNVSDVQGGTGTLSAIVPASVAKLAPGDSTSFSANYVLTQADVDAGSDISNTATASATPVRGTLAPVTDVASISPELPAPALSIAKSVSGSATVSTVGQTADFDYVVTNTGNVSVSTITVSDDKIATVNCPADTLAPSESLTCTATHTVTQADLNAGRVTNTATASGTPARGTLSPSASDTATLTAEQNPALSVVKTALDTTFAAVGDELDYTFEVTNTGNVEITALTLTDSRIGAVACPVSMLAPAASTTCTATDTVDQDDLDAGSVTNTATANGTPAGGTLAPAMDSATVGGDQAPNLSITKRALDSDFAAVGDQIDYEYIVTNTGNVTLTEAVTVLDDKITVPRIVSCPALPMGGLVPNASLTCTATYGVTQADLDAGQVTNVATASSGALTSAPDTVTVSGTQSPALTLTKAARDTNFDAVGDVLTYDYTVTNTGNVGIGALDVSDDRIDTVTCNVPAVGNGDTVLDPGEAVVCTGSDTVTQADLDSGSITNTATATGIPAGGTLTPPSDTATVGADQAPTLTLVKTANQASFDAVGDVLTYDYLVTNTGNVGIGALSVSDDKIATVACDVAGQGDGDAVLDPAEAVICTATYTVTQADLDAGSVTNMASATGTPSGGSLTPPTDSATVDADRQPSLETVKTATSVNFEQPGDVTTYQYVVTNTGNVTLTDPITVTDNLISAVSCPALPAGGLAPGANLTCTASYTVTQADLDAGSVTNLASAVSGTTRSPQTSETIPADQNPGLSIAKRALSGSITAAGQVVTYEFDVTNSGNLTLTGGVTVVDDKIGTIACISGNFVPGATQTCSADYTVTQADLDAGGVTNQAFARNKTLTSPPASVTLPADQAPALSFDKRAATADFSSVGDRIDYRFDLANTGNVTLVGVGVSDPLIGVVNCPRTTLAPSESVTCTGRYTVTQADVDAGEVINSATASGNPPTGQPVTPTDSVTTPGAGQARATFAKRAVSSDFDAAGDVLVYEFDVANTGDLTLASIDIADPLIVSVTCPVAVLAPGQITVCSGQYTVTQADLDRGFVVNTATLAATLPNGDALPSLTDTARVNATLAPRIRLSKNADQTDFNAVGDTLTYTYTVTNAGNTTLTDVSVTDDRIASVTCAATTLTPGANTTCTGSDTVTQADLDAGSVTNVATVTAVTSGGTLAPSTATATVTGSQTRSLDLVKTATTTDYDRPGATLDYTYTVTNTGNVTLTDVVSVADDKISAVSCPALPAGGLAPNTALTCTATYVVTQADVDAGAVTNLATATSGITMSAQASETVTGTRAPALTMTKTASPQSVATLGETVSYTYVVTNTGNTTVTSSISIADNRTTVSCPTLPANGLAPGGMLTCTATDTVSQAYLDAGSITNTASATDGTTSSPSVDETVTVDAQPALSLVKAALDTSYAVVGDVLDYSFTVTNTGNITLTQAITVSDDRIGGVSCPPLPAGRLAPGASLVCTASDTVTQADIDAGSVTNTATASSGSTVSPSDTATVNANQQPALTVDKSALDTSFAAPGDVLDYSYLVTNTGNVTLMGAVTVSDDRIGTVACPALPTAGLAPGGMVTCTGSDVVTQADIDAGAVTNTATASSGTTTSPNDAATVSANQDPSLGLEKRALDFTYSSPGDTLDYEFIATNTGNTTITAPLTVADSRIGSVTCPALPAGGLAPGASVTCTGSDTVTQADIDAGVVENTATVTDGTVTSDPQTRRVFATRTTTIEIEKTAVNVNFTLPGDVVAYQYEITNTGNVTITDPVSVDDNFIGAVTCPPLPAGGLAPGATLTCAADYVVTQDNLDVGVVTNIATASTGTLTSAPTSETIPANQNPAIEMRKSSLDTSFSTVGQVLTYAFEIENTGNVTLTNTVEIVDNKIGRFACFTGNFVPGQIETCTETYTVTQEDIDRGEVTNDAYAEHPRASSPPDFVTIPATQTPAITLAKVALTADFDSLGDTLSYRYDVTNSGNVTLTFPVSVTDDRVSVSCPALPIGGLAPGGVLSCTATDTVAQADIDSGAVTNTAIATAGGLSTSPQTATVNAVQMPELSLNKIAQDTDFTTVGDTLDYSFVVTNSGNTTITAPVTVTDSRIGALSCPAGPIAPGAAITCAGQDTVTQADLDAGSVTNTATATDGNVTTPVATQTVTGTQTPALDIVKTALSGSFAAVGDTLDYEYAVTNTGNVTLTDPIVVADDRIASVNCPALPAGGLAPAATLTCTATDTVDQADLDAGSVVNTASATSGATTSAPVSATVAAMQSPQLTLVKTALDTDFSAAGDALAYGYEVRNSGNVTITQAITISDDRIADVACPSLPAGGLAPGASLTCAGTDVLNQADLDAGSVTNTATATDGTTTSLPDSAIVMGTQTRGLGVNKVALSNDFAAVGDTLTYEYIVRNTGNVSVTEPITVVDDRIASVTCPALPSGGLVPGAALTCSATDTVDQADLDAGSVTNTATARAGSGELTAPDTVTVEGTQSPALTIEKSTSATSISAVGEVVSYTYTVTNTGNVTITEPVTVADDKIAAVSCPDIPAGGLATGASITCTADYSVVQADLDTGGVTNVATASAGSTASEPDSVTVAANAQPALAIVKRATTESFSMPGDIVSYAYDITNTGNVSLNAMLMVEDDKIAVVDCPAVPDGGFAPGATLTCTADYAVTQDDIDAGEVVNLATASSGTTESPEVSETVQADTMPNLRVEKRVASRTQVGGPVYDISYEVALINDGNITLNGLSVTDDLLSHLAPATLVGAPTLSTEGFVSATLVEGYDGSASATALENGILGAGKTGILSILARIDTTAGGPALGNTAIVLSPQLPAPVPSDAPVVTPDVPTDTNPTPLVIVDTDGDGAPDDRESPSDDRDGDGIPDSEDYDPTGYFYCEEDGSILSGGGITVTGPNGANSSIGAANDIVIVRDGSDGQYQFYTTAPGLYTLSLDYPETGQASTIRTPQPDPIDATTLLPANPGILGGSEVGDTNVLSDTSIGSNTPFYTQFLFEPGDPVILMNNIPLKNCSTPELTVAKTAVGEPEPVAEGRQRLQYEIVATNSGLTDVGDVELSDDLGAVFGAGNFTLESVVLGETPPNYTGRLNVGYDGVTDVNLLEPVDDLESGQAVSVTLTVVVDALVSRDYVNTAVASGTFPLDGSLVTGEGTSTVALLANSEVSEIEVSKTARPRTVQIGDPVLYTVEITNAGSISQSDLRILDLLPEEFAYIPGSARFGGADFEVQLEPAIARRGLVQWDLAFGAPAELEALGPGETIVLNYSLLAGPNVSFGSHENQAVVESLQSGERSNVASAVIDYIPEPSFDCTPVLGRVYDDVNENGYPDDGEPGIPGARLVTVNGETVTTDEFGRYHIPCAVIPDAERGSNYLLKADTRALPLGYVLTTENPRVVRATRGKFVKMNFGAAHRAKLRFDMSAADVVDGALTGEATRRLDAVLVRAETAERALILYRAAPEESVEKAQAVLRLALAHMKANADFRDVAMEATWGRPAERGDEETSDTFAGALYEAVGLTPRSDRPAAPSSSVGFADRGGDVVPLPTLSLTSDDQYDAPAGMRGDRRDGIAPSRERSPVQGRSDASSRPTPRLTRWLGWSDRVGAYAKGTEIETKVDALDPVKRLNVQANMVTREIRAEGYWNYGTFIEEAELRVFPRGESTRKEPLATSAFVDSEARVALSADWPVELDYVLRVIDADGRFDETAPKPLRIGEPEDDLTEADWQQQRGTAFGEDTMRVDTIRVRGASVTLYGRNVPGAEVTAFGDSVRVDQSGRFVAEQILPGGAQTVEVLMDGADGPHRVVRALDVPTSGQFYTGIIDVTLGERANAVGGDSSITGGRIAGYLRKRFNERWTMSATLDTGEADIGDLFSGLDDKNLDQLLRRLDPDRYYPTYGDDSFIVEDAPTSGRFYARLERDDDYLLWGNYRTGFDDTEFARVQRTLYGAKLSWDQNTDPTALGDARTTLDAFIAGGGSRQGRDVLRGTGGSVYYLRNGDIAIGSEIVRVERRDSVSGLVSEQRRLVYGIDYDIDYIQGRILLSRPLGSTLDDGRLFRDGTLSGDTQTLVVDYEFTPLIDDGADSTVFGVRGTRWIGDRLRIGATLNRDDYAGVRSDLIEADAILQFGPGTYIKGEIARSEGLGVDAFQSLDGGFTYDPLPRGSADFGGVMAYAVEGAVDFEGGEAAAYWRRRGEGFAGYAEATNQAVEQFGARVTALITERIKLHARGDITDSEFIGSNSLAEATVEVAVAEATSVTVGASYSKASRGTSGTSVGARVTHKLGDDESVYAFGQVGIEGDNPRTTDRVGLGAELGLTRNILATGEISMGEDGLGARAGARWQYEDGDELYLSYDLPIRGSLASDYGTFNIGTRQRFSDALSVYGEERLQFAGRSGLHGVTHAYGVDYSPGNWNIDVSGETGRVDIFDRDAVSLNVGFGDERVTAGIGMEWRNDENIDTGDERETWLLRATSTIEASDELRLQGKFNMALSDQARDFDEDGSLGPVSFNEARFKEASVALAYRPIWDDRFNLLGKLVWLDDLSPTSQRFDGETLNYRQRSFITSVDGSYDLSPRWTLGGKFAYRTGEVTSSRQTLDFTRSEAGLGVFRLDYHTSRLWDVTLEARRLDIGGGVIVRNGGLAGIYRHLGDNAKVGLGATYGGIEEAYLSADEDEGLGYFLNMIGKF